MKDILRLEDRGETAVLQRAARSARSSSPGTRGGITAADVFDDALNESGGRGDGGGGSGGVQGSTLYAKRLATARASKLVRAEAEAYADVQVKCINMVNPRTCSTPWDFTASVFLF